MLKFGRGPQCFIAKDTEGYITNVKLSLQHSETHKIILKLVLEIILYTKEQNAEIDQLEEVEGAYYNSLLN